MSMSVADVLAIDVVRNGEPEVVAVGDQLDRPVRWVHISEQTDVAAYLKGGELLLTTGMSLGSDPDADRAFICELAAAGAAGVVFRLGSALPDIPRHMIVAAESQRLPLIALHRRIGFVEVTERVHAEIVSREALLLNAADRLRIELSALVLDGGGTREILARLTRSTGGVTVLEDLAHLVVEVTAGGDETWYRGLVAAWDAHSRQGHLEASGVHVAGSFIRTTDGGYCAWAPIWAGGEPWGRLHLIRRDRPVDDAGLLAVDRAATAISLALLGDRRPGSELARSSSALLADLAHERLSSHQDFFQRSRALGVDLSGESTVGLAVRAGGIDRLTSSARLDDDERRALLDDLLRHVQEGLAETSIAGLAGLVDGEVLAVVALAAADVGERLAAFSDVLHHRSTSIGDGRLTPVIGVSHPAAPYLVRRAVRQAAESAMLGERLGGPGTVFHFGDLSLHHLLLATADGPHLASYLEAELGAVLQYDAENRSSLVMTLRAYLDHGARATATAQALFIDRRTLYHRLSIVERLLQRDLREGDTQLRIGVALRALDLLRERTSPRAIVP
jgi:purine catabolism regulator